MSNHQTPVPNDSDVPAVQGHMNALFDEPSNKTGDDAPATCSQQNPLYRIGTVPRIQFDQRNEMIVQVKFKIHTEMEVAAEQPTLIKVASRTRKSAASAAVRYNLIESKMFNQGNVIDLVKCLFGKSLNDFKGMCGDICEEYEPGMRHMVLKSDLAPRLRWMGQVGREKVFLVDCLTWQSFVDLLAKATKHKGSVTIYTENPKEQAKKVAQTSAAKQFIASASGSTGADAQVGELTKELEDARKRIALHELTAQIFHEQSQKGTSGDGAILVCPWDPSFQYRMTWNGAWVWAKGVQAGMATREIPPRTYEYLAIIKKSRVFHKGLKVDDRVKMQSSHLNLDLSPTFKKSGGSTENFFESPARLLFQKASSSKRSAIFADIGRSEDKQGQGQEDKKKIKLEPTSPSGVGKGITIVLSSDPVEPTKGTSSQNFKIHIKDEPGLHSHSGFGQGLSFGLSSGPGNTHALQSIKKEDTYDAAASFSSLFGHGETVIISSDPPTVEKSENERAAAHAAALESFLVQCNVPKEDETTRTILKRAGITSWTDLLPSLQFTESSLTSRGMHPALASHLLSEAMDRLNALQDDIDESPDEEQPNDDELDDEDNGDSTPSTPPRHGSSEL